MLGVVGDRRASRPEAPAPEDRQQRRQQGEPGDHRAGDADRRDRAERRRVLRVGQRQDQHRQGHGQAAGEDRGPRAAQGARHRLVLVLGRAQLLAQSRDQQQAVVGADAEHQHDQDRGRVRGDGRAALRQQVDEPVGDGVGEEDDDQRRQRDQHRAVDRAEQDQDQEHGREQQLRVDVAEDLGGVGVEAEVAGEQDLHPVGFRARGLADRIAPVGDVLEVGRHGEHRVGERAVGGDELLRRVGPERRHRRPGQRQLVVGQRLERLRVVGDLLLVRLGQPAVALVDDQALARLLIGEPVVEQVDDLGRLGALGQERGGVVLGLVGELRAERGEEDREHDPQPEDHELGPASGDEGGESAHAARHASAVSGGRRSRSLIARSARCAQADTGLWDAEFRLYMSRANNPAEMNMKAL